ncbi:MAG: hypothetical protein SFT90_03345 [Rickettsiales bacterium]|nr:hypothetical protein [Rickettsiales bacterium]
MQSKYPKYWNEACNYLSKKDAILSGLIRQFHNEKLLKNNSAFLTLARSIIGQQISVKAADSIWAKFELALKNVAEKYNEKNHISPKNLFKLELQELKNCGLSEQKIKYLNNIADFFDKEFSDMEDLSHLNENEIAEKLLSIKGVGKWTIEMFLLFHMHSADIFPLADIGLLKAIENQYNVKRNTKKFDAKVNQLSKLWQPYRSVATWYLWRSIDPVPVEY